LRCKSLCIQKVLVYLQPKDLKILKGGQGPSKGNQIPKPAKKANTKTPGVQDDIKQRPIIKEDDFDAELFGKSLCKCF